MTKTISGSTYATSGYTFTSIGASPLTVAAGAIVGNATAAGIDSTLAAYISVSNSGTVSSGSGYGINLASAGGISNLGSALITGHGGILTSGSLTLYDAPHATIVGQLYGVGVVGAAGSVNNEGIIQGVTGGGIFLALGGTITNQSSATIEAAGYAVGASGGPLTVTNHGTISSSARAGVYLQTGAVNNTSIVSGDRYGIRSIGTANVSNSGLVVSTEASGGVGVLMQGGGSLGNTGSILSDFYGAFITGGATTAATVVNSGTIASYLVGDGAGLVVADGGNITNQAGGAIDGKWIGFQSGSFANRTAEYPAITLTNFGSIAAADQNGDGAAVWIHSPGVVINEANANIQTSVNGTISGGVLNGLPNGGFGVVAYYQTTLVNYGTIGGSSDAFDAANAGTAIANLIEIAPGSKFAGLVRATNATASGVPLATLELLSAASAGTVSGFGSEYLGFKTVTLTNGANWSLAGTVAGSTTLDFAADGAGSLTLVNAGMMQGTIVGFSPHETLALAGIISTTGVSLSASNVLTVEGAGLTLAFDPAQNFTSTPFQENVVGNETLLTLQCFAAGTRIATERGPVALEDLAEGMSVVTARGEIKPIVWIGHRLVDCASHPNPAAVWPVRIRAGAFGPGQPAADLWLSPDHAVFFDGVLIPVHCLIDGRMIAQEHREFVMYYHVELPEHDVVLAEGLPVESYLETGDRANFANGGDAVRLFPDFGRAPALPGAVAWAWETMACAPLTVSGQAVEAARRAVAMRRRAGATQRLPSRRAAF